MHFLLVKAISHSFFKNGILLTKARAQGFGYIVGWNVYGGKE
jgi:hypothetical protein